jgi:hypothetical protein
MQKEWQLAEQLRVKNRLLHLLAVTYGDRRELTYSHASTAAIRQAYPALFSTDAIVQEFEMVSNCCNSVELARTNILKQAPLLVEKAKLLRQN